MLSMASYREMDVKNHAYGFCNLRCQLIMASSVCSTKNVFVVAIKDVKHSRWNKSQHTHPWAGFILSRVYY